MDCAGGSDDGACVVDINADSFEMVELVVSCCLAHCSMKGAPMRLSSS